MKNRLIIIVTLLILIVFFFPKQVEKGGMPPFVDATKQYYVEERNCFGFKAPSLIGVGVEGVRPPRCYGIPYGKNCYLESSSPQEGYLKIATECAQ